MNNISNVLFRHVEQRQQSPAVISNPIALEGPRDLFHHAVANEKVKMPGDLFVVHGRNIQQASLFDWLPGCFQKLHQQVQLIPPPLLLRIEQVVRDSVMRSFSCACVA